MKTIDKKTIEEEGYELIKDYNPIRLYENFFNKLVVSIEYEPYKVLLFKPKNYEQGSFKYE